MDRLLTGLQPSGSLTIGNYAGGISQVVNYQKDYETLLFVPDMHAITVPQDPDALHRNIINAIAMYIACGVDPNLPNMHIYIQSENLYHANLSWIFECHTPHGDLTRMHQFKAKSALHEIPSTFLRESTRSSTLSSQEISRSGSTTVTANSSRSLSL